MAVTRLQTQNMPAKGCYIVTQWLTYIKNYMDTSQCQLDWLLRNKTPDILYQSRTVGLV